MLAPEVEDGLEAHAAVEVAVEVDEGKWGIVRIHDDMIS
jgi:hypothetical protein